MGETPCGECQAAHVATGKRHWAGLTTEQRSERKRRNRNEAERYRRDSPILARAAKYRLIGARKELINAAKDVPCTDCGIKYPPYVMQFDHLRDKEFQIGNSFTFSLERVLAEIEKCEVVCANCHAERTHQRWIERRANDEAI